MFGHFIVRLESNETQKNEEYEEETRKRKKRHGSHLTSPSRLRFF